MLCGGIYGDWWIYFERKPERGDFGRLPDEHSIDWQREQFADIARDGEQQHDQRNLDAERDDVGLQRFGQFTMNKS